MKLSTMESYNFDAEFNIEGIVVQPVHARIEKLRPIIAAHSHSRTSYEIHCTVRGRGAVTVSDVRYPVYAGLLYVTGPEIVHAQHSDPADPVLEYCLYLNCRAPAQNKRATAVGKSFANTKFWIGPDTEDVAGAVLQLIEEERARRFGHESMLQAVIHKIIVLLARTYQDESMKGDVADTGRFTSAAGYYPMVEDGFFYGYQTLKLEEVAEMLHFSKRQTQRFLKGHYGKTFTQKLTEARMSAAAQMLINTSMTIGEIAEQTGFSSGEHFSTAFRRYYNMSPGSYRKEKRQQTD